MNIAKFHLFHYQNIRDVPKDEFTIRLEFGAQELCLLFAKKKSALPSIPHFVSFVSSFAAPRVPCKLSAASL